MTCAPYPGAHNANPPGTPALDTGDKIKPDRRSAACTVVESSLTPSPWEIFPAASPAQLFVVSHSSCPILTDLSSRLIPVVGFSLHLLSGRRAAWPCRDARVAFGSSREVPREAL